MKQTLWIYKAKDGFRWHLKSGNGRIVAESGEAYVRRDAARKMGTRLFPKAKVFDL